MRPDTVSAGQGAAVTFSPLGNDTPGQDGAGNPGTFDPASLRLVDAGGTPVTTLTVAGVGTYTANPDGTISPAVMADYLHPTAYGYELYAAAVRPLLPRGALMLSSLARVASSLAL